MHAFLAGIFSMFALITGQFYQYFSRDISMKMFLLLNTAYIFSLFLLIILIMVLAFDWNPSHLSSTFLLIGNTGIIGTLSVLYHTKSYIRKSTVIDYPYSDRKESSIR